MARKKRHSRRNSWFGNAVGHRKAALRGWGVRKYKKSRKIRSNAGGGTIAASVESIKEPVKATLQGFKIDTLKSVGMVVVGNIVTNMAAKQVQKLHPSLGGNKILNIGSTLLTAGAAGVVAKRFAPKYANDVLVGGLLAGLSSTLKSIWPQHFGSLADDLEGIGDDGLGNTWMIGPGEAAAAIPMNVLDTNAPVSYVQQRSPYMRGMESYMHPSQPVVSLSGGGMGDEATVPQVENAVRLDGMDETVADVLSQA